MKKITDWGLLSITFSVLFHILSQKDVPILNWADAFFIFLFVLSAIYLIIKNKK